MNNVIPFRGKDKFCEVVKQVKPDRFHLEQQGDMWYLLDRMYPNITAGDKSAIHCTVKEHIDGVCKTMNIRENGEFKKK